MDYSLFLDILTSLQRFFVGYIPATVLGSLIGYFIGINATMYQIFRRLFQLPHSIPPIALLPIFLIIFKEHEAAIVTIVFLGTLWSTILNIAIGMRHFRRQDNNFRVAIFHIFHALRVGVWVAWLTVIAAEMLLMSKGLGFVIWDSYKAGDKIDLIEAIMDVAIIGALLDQLLDVTGYLLAQMVTDSSKS